MMVLIALLVWPLIGCTVLAGLDDDQRSLLAWAKTCPLGCTFVLYIWPIVAVAVLRDRLRRNV